MPRRIKSVIAILIALIGCALIAIILDVPIVDDFKVTKDNFDRLRVGMTRGEVRTVFGSASDHYSPEGGRGWVWEGAEGNGYLLFGVDGNGSVSELTWIDLGRSPEEIAAWEREQRAYQRGLRRNGLYTRIEAFIDSVTSK